MFCSSLSAPLFFRWPLTSAIFTPPRPTTPAYDGLHESGSEETGCYELLESGRVRLFGDGHGPRAVHAKAQDATQSRIKGPGAYHGIQRCVVLFFEDADSDGQLKIFGLLHVSSLV